MSQLGRQDARGIGLEDLTGEAVEGLYRGALGPVPLEMAAGLPEAVFAATTRRPVASAHALPRRRMVLGLGAGVGALAAGATFLTLRAGEAEKEEKFNFAEVDFELLDELELCREYELLSVLEALEEIDRG